MCEADRCCVEMLMLQNAVQMLNSMLDLLMLSALHAAMFLLSADRNRSDSLPSPFEASGRCFADEEGASLFPALYVHHQSACCALIQQWH